MGLRRGAAGMAGGHDDRSAVAQAGSQERSVSPYPISMISARSSRAGKLRRRLVAGGGLSRARSGDASAGESHRAASECDLFSRYLFSLGVSAGRGRLYRDAGAGAPAATEAKRAEIGSIFAIHRMLAQNPPVVGRLFQEPTGSAASDVEYRYGAGWRDDRCASVGDPRPAPGDRIVRATPRATELALWATNS